VARNDLPTGTVTFLFTDVEGSTKLLHELGSETYAETLAEHRRLVRMAFARHGGIEVDTQGDAFFIAFPTAPSALDAAREAQEALAQGPIRVRMGIHTGTPHVTEEGYVGPDVHKGARIAAAGHGGQVLLSKEARALAEVEVTDLGEHRLKDFDEPVWISQLGTERFPPLKTISNTNLPRPASSFVGREKEVEEVVALLQDGARLLTLTGPGGSGKTRLAIEAAAEVVPEFRNGVFWVELSPLRDPALVLETIAPAVGAKDGLASYIGERDMLLVLDNFEQVIEASPELSDLLEACPNLRFLVTSRELLRIRGEVEYAVPPLAELEAVELFYRRAQLKEPADTVAELCRRLDNLPLAVELAAARTSVLSPTQILERLPQRLDLLKGGRDAETRQQTLRSTIEWSYELLSSEEKALFVRLAVFRGGCTLEAAGQVTGADLDTLQSLVEKSLLRHGDERFWMLETIREYAAERLEASGGAKGIRRRHAEHFLALAEEVEPHLRVEYKEWPDRLEREHDNLRASLDLLEAAGETQLALRLAGAVWVFWRDRSHMTEGRRRLESALRADERPTAARAKALNGASFLATFSGDAATGRLQGEEALAIHRTLGDAWGTADSLHWLGWAVAMDGDWAQAQPLLDESRQRFQELGDEYQTLDAAHDLAWAYGELGDRERARALEEENLRRARELGNEQTETTILDLLASYAVDEGRAEDALSLATESLRLYQDIGDLGGVAIELRRCASAFVLKGEAGTAVRLLASSETLYADIGGTMPWVARMTKETLARIRAQLDEAAVAEAWEEGRKLTTDEAVALALESLE
jgi:predicted ATPase